ncbi:MAG: hypothetical protein IJM81_02625 [Prevotella sp.]|nr:hypothetical protein [Prevotella sp.]
MLDVFHVSPLPARRLRWCWRNVLTHYGTRRYDGVASSSSAGIPLANWYKLLWSA